MSYFDNAATTQMSDVALDALIYATKECYGNPSSLHFAGKNAKKLLEESRKIIAKCIGAEPEEIYFTSGGTESDNWAILQLTSQKCEYVITSAVEHHAILKPIEMMENAGAKAIYLPVSNGCVVDVDSLKASLSGKKALVSIMLQNNETGVVQPIKEMAKAVHSDNELSLFHVDAVQAIGHINVDVNDLGVDMLSASAHKFNGPKGVGFLYVKKGRLISSLITGGGQECGLRSGTENVAGIYAMAKALEDNIIKIDESTNHIKKLEDYFFAELQRNNVEYTVNGDNSVRTTGVINISIKGIDGEGLLNMLDMHGICISIGSACNSKAKEPSYVLTAMRIEEERIDSAVRISMGKYNTKEEVDELVYYIAKLNMITAKVK